MLGFLLAVAAVWLVVTAALWVILLLVVAAERIGLLHPSAGGAAERELLRLRVEGAIAED